MANGDRKGEGPRRMRARVAGLPPVALVGLALVLLLAGLVFWASVTYTVVAEGELLPWDVGPVYQVELFDRVTIYASGETALATDALSGFLLAATAGVALLAYALLSGRADASGARARLCFLLAALGATALALAERAGLHETLGYNLPFLADIPGIERPDDAIILAYSAPAVAFLVVFRDVLFGERRTGALFLLGIGLFGAAAVLDVLGGFVEELLESLAALALLAGFLVLAVDRIREAGPAQFRHDHGAEA